MTSKLQLASQRRRQQLIIQEFTPTDSSSIVRQQLKDNIEPDDWNNGFFPAIDEQRPDIFFFQQSHEGLIPTLWPDLKFIGRYHDYVLAFDDGNNQVDVIFNSNHHFEFNEYTPTLSPAECAWRRREHKWSETPSPGCWRSNQPIQSRTQVDDTAKHQQLLHDLRQIEQTKDQFVNITIHFKGGQYQEVLPFDKKKMLEYGTFSMKNKYSIKETLGGLLDCELKSVSSWTVVDIDH
jgi:hypothetical protein